MKYFIKTFGCQMNFSDSERIAGFLESLPHPLPAGRHGNHLLRKEKGFKPAEKINDADIVIFNTCGVRQMAEDRVYGQIHNLRKNNSEIKIALTGCLANRKDVQRKLKEKVDLFFPINNFDVLKNWLIKNYFKIVNSKLKITAQKNNTTCADYLSIIPRYENSKTAYVPVMTGCNNFCAYCVVPYARGREQSRPTEEIFKEIKNLANKKYKEIILLGQNVNSYNFKIKNSKLKIDWELVIGNWELKRQSKNHIAINFPVLLNALARNYPKIYWRFLTSHPKDFSDKLMEVIAKNKNISREIHLPIQAGSDKILKAMNRPYTKKHYLGLIKKAQELIPEVSFTTDVIVGFPGETEKDFQETVKVFKKVNFSEAYINKYSPRPGTAAFSLGDPISWQEKKRREKVLRELL